MRFPDESDEAFFERAIRAGQNARVLVTACFQNKRVQELLTQGQLAERSLRSCPIVRVEFEEALAIGGIGETLSATRHKRWGDGPWIMPLLPDDTFFPERITYIYRENSLYNRRFEQRIRMKELLGKNRKLVGIAKYSTKDIFLKHLSSDHVHAIRQCLSVEPGIFWRAAQGKIFLDLPRRERQREFDFRSLDTPDA